MTGREPVPPAAPDRQLPEVKGLPVLPPLAALAEIVVLFAAIYAIDRVLPNLAIFDLSPHPFWVPVLFVSLQYGTVSGFLAAAVAIALTLFGGLPEQDIGENLFAYFLRVLGQPILWIGVALLVGQFRMRQLEAKQELRHANHALTVQRDDLARHAVDLRTRVETLEQELVTRYAAPPHAVAARLAATMVSGGLQDTGASQSVLQQAAAALFPDCIITAYRLDRGQLTEFAVVGRKPATGPRITIPADDPLFAAVIGEGRTVSILDRSGEQTLMHTGLAAAPILSAAAGITELSSHGANGSQPASPAPPQPFGMLVMERGGPDAIGPDGLLALELLAHLLQPRAPRHAAPAPTAQAPRRIRKLAELQSLKLGGGKPDPAAEGHPRQDSDAKPDWRQRRAGLLDRIGNANEAAHASVSITSPSHAAKSHAVDRSAIIDEDVSKLEHRSETVTTTPKSSSEP